MSLALNTKHLSSFINEEEYKAIYPQVEAAHKTLEAKNGPGSDFLGWMYLPRDYDKEEFARIKEAAAKIREDSDVLVVAGIGGSYLGARAVIEAVKGQFHNELENGPKIYFCGNSISPTYLNNIINLCKGKRFSINVISKSGTTTETSLAFRVLRKLLEDEMGVEEANKRIYATTDRAKGTLKQLADAQGWPTFVVPDDVGGRYSVDSAVGLSLIVVLGPERFQQFLEGFHAIDEYFCNTPLENNAVALMGLLNVWYVNFFGSKSHAVLPYCQYLHRFPAYLQQLTMESNGKHVRWDGSAVTSDTGEIFWGEPGTNGQHAFYQLLHQGTVVVPADFIAFANTANPATDSGQDVHELFLGNFLAQTKALAFGKTADEVRAEGTPEQIVPARCFEGNRPTTSIFGDTLTPFALGELIALYEHITFVEGTVWGIDSYDQWGVELGKQLAKQITPAFHDDAAKAEQDASTQALIEFYRAHRK